MWVDKVIVGIVSIIVIAVIWIWNEKRQSGKIVIRRKPKIKLNEICRKYYDKCEELIFPIAHNYTVYHRVLQVVEKNLKQNYSQYQYNLKTGQQYPYQDYYHDMFKEVDLFNIKCWSLYVCKKILASELSLALVSENEGKVLSDLKREYEICVNSPDCPINFLDAWEEYEILANREKQVC